MMILYSVGLLSSIINIEEFSIRLQTSSRKYFPSLYLSIFIELRKSIDFYMNSLEMLSNYIFI